MTSSANDQAIIAAWGRYRVARGIFSAMPSSGPMQPGTDNTVAEYEQISVFHAEGEFLAKVVASSLEALECKLWFALSQCNDEAETFILSALREDTLYFEEIHDAMDWPAKVAFSCIQSLHTMRLEGASA